MYSSGTTGKVKGAMLTHRNLISTTAGFYADRTERESPAVVLYTVPYYHIFGFSYCVKSIGVNDTAVVMERFELSKMVKAVEEFRVSHLMAVPAVVVSMVKKSSSISFNTWLWLELFGATGERWSYARERLGYGVQS